MPRTEAPLRAALSILLACAGMLALASPARAELRAGFAVEALPAPAGGPLGGYGGLFDRNAAALRDPPEARALVIEQGGVRAALVALDVVIARPALAAKARALTPAVDWLAVVATHTHSGPGGYLPGFLSERLSTGGYRADTERALAATVARVLERASADLAPARSAAGAARLPRARNRRHDDGPAETAVPVWRLGFDGARPDIVVFAFGAHATVLSPASRAYSADYPGAARAALERAGWRALFLPGPLGDQAPVPAQGELWPDDVARQSAQVDEIGSALASAVADFAARLAPLPAEDTELCSSQRSVELPPLRVRPWCPLWWAWPLAGSAIEAFASARAPVQALALGGDLRLLTLPAEPVSALGQALRDRSSAGAATFVIAHANDWTGYTVTRETWHDGGYEACMSLFGPDQGAFWIEHGGAALAAVDRCAGQPDAAARSGDVELESAP